MRPLEKNMTIEDELHDLKLRFELLEGDRKAYYETSQWAIRQNKEEISQLRAQNRSVGESIAKLKKRQEAGHPGRSNFNEIEKMEQKVCEIHKRYDDMKSDAKRKEHRVREMYDQLADLRIESEMVQSNLEDSSKAKEIRMLENRLDKAMIKYNEAQSIKKTYDQIVKKLQEERLTFDNQLAHFEKTLKARKQEALELEMMSRDANHAKEVAKAELLRFEQQINEERKQRERDLQQRKELVKQKMEVNEKLERKALQLDGPSNDPTQQNDQNKDNYDEVKEKKIAEYEETIRLIKEATGVSDLQEVIVKFQSQGDTHAHLVQLQKQNESRIEELRKKKAQVLAEYDELKFNGESKHAHSRRLIEEFQQHLKDATAKESDAKFKFERAVKLLTDAESGITHLFDKIDSIHVPGEPTKSAETGNSVLSVLDVCVQKLEFLVKNVQGKEIPETVQPVPNASAPPGSVGEPVGILQVNPSLLPQFNTRVKLRPLEFEEEIIEDDENDDDFGEVPDRETIKKHTTQMLNSRQKTKQSKKLKKKKAADA